MRPCNFVYNYKEIGLPEKQDSEVEDEDEEEDFADMEDMAEILASLASKSKKRAMDISNTQRLACSFVS